MDWRAALYGTVQKKTVGSGEVWADDRMISRTHDRKDDRWDRRSNVGVIGRVDARANHPTDLPKRSNDQTDVRAVERTVG